MRTERYCRRCGAEIKSPNRARKYCSDACAIEQHREDSRNYMRRRKMLDPIGVRQYKQTYNREYYQRQKAAKTKCIQ